MMSAKSYTVISKWTLKLFPYINNKIKRLDTSYQHIDSAIRGFQGTLLTEEECNHYLGLSKGNLLDNEQRKSLLNDLRALQEETGFSSERIMVDIQALENDHLNVPLWRIGEAVAEIVLEENFQCRFHWNELRDARNPKGNKTGADLVGFIEIDGRALFLFGEVKTSSENPHPPQVMTCEGGMENQLCDLCNHPEKRRILISYLQNKARLFPDGHPFKDDFNASIKSYYSENGRYHLVGVLVRDTEPVKEDVSESYHRIKNQILEPAGLKLLALYIPVKKSEWLKIINEIA